MTIVLEGQEISQAIREYVSRHYGIAEDRIPRQLQWSGNSAHAKSDLKIEVEVGGGSDPYRSPV